MSKNVHPKLCRQKRNDGNDVGYVILSGQKLYCGRWGLKETTATYKRLLGEWLAAGCRLPVEPDAITILECADIYTDYINEIYQNSRSTRERVHNVMQLLIEKYGRMEASKFTAIHLRALREELINPVNDPDRKKKRRPLVVKSINERCDIIVKMFRYLASMDMIPPTPAQKCAMLDHLKASHPGVKVSKQVEPVPRADVEKTIVYLNRSTAAIVKLMLLTGARPGEICCLRQCDFNTTGDMWKVTLKQHKTAHKGKVRTLVFGKEAQEILRPFFLLRKPDEPLFSPKDHWEERHENATTPRRVNQADTPRISDRVVGDVYDTTALRKAITRAAKKAGVTPWHPHQVRHTRASELREQFGIEAAVACLGHSTVRATEIYAKVNEAAVEKIMRLVG